MKTKILIVALFVSMVFFSCKETQKAGVDNKLEFDTIRIEKTHYYMGDTAQTSATIAVSFVYPIVKDGDSVAAKVRDIIASLYFEDSLYVSLEPQKSTNLYVENFGKIFNQTLDSYKNQLDEFDGEDPFFTVSEILKGHVLYSKNDILSFQVERYSSRMDSIFFTQYVNCAINLKTGEPIKEEDIFVEDSEDALHELFEKHLLTMHNVKKLEDLDNDDFGYVNLQNMVSNGNFYIDDEGITYTFNSGEYSSPKIPAIKITLQYSEIAHLIKDDSLIKQFLP